MDLGSILVRIGADTSKLDQSAAQAVKSLNQVGQSATQSAQAVEVAGKKYEKVFVQVGDRIEEIQIDMSGMATSVLKDMGMLDKGARDSAAAAAQASDKTVGAMQNVATAASVATTKATHSWKSLADNMKSAGSTMTKLFTVPIMAVGTLATASSLAWDDAMDEIIIRTGATGAELESLQASFRKVGRETPSNIQDVAAVISELNTRMDLSGDTVVKLAVQFLDAGRMAKIGPAQLTEAFGQMARGWSLGVSQYADANDRMWAASQTTGINMLQLQQAMTDLGPTLRSLGYDFDRSTALIGRFYELGVDPGNLTTALRTATAQYREMGVEPQKGLAAYAKGIREAKDEQTRLALATQVFGERAAPLMADAIKRGAFQLDEFLARLAASPGAISKTNEATWGWSERLGQLKNQFSESFAPIGDKVLGLVSEKMPTVAEAVDRLVTSFSELDPKKQDAFIVGMATLAVTGPALITAAAALSAIAALANPVVLAAVAITGLATGIGILWSEMASFERKLKEQPATPFAKLDKATQAQFRNTASTLKSKDPERAKFAASDLGVTTDQLVKAGVIDKNSKLLMTDDEALLDTLAALWQGKHESQRPPEPTKPAPSARADLDKQMAALRSNMDKQVAELFGSGAAIPATVAEGIRAAEKLVQEAMLEMYGEADKTNPHSDAKIGPFSRLTQSGRSLPRTIAKGINQTAAGLATVGQHLAASVMSPMDSMRRRLDHNTRGMRDTLGDLWWQTGDRIAAATRYGVDSALGNLDNLSSPSMSLHLDEEFLKFAPDELKDAVEAAFKMNGPFDLTLDANLQPKFKGGSIIEQTVTAELKKIGPLKIEIPAELGVNWLSLNSITPTPVTSAVDSMIGSLSLLRDAGNDAAASLSLSLDDATLKFDRSTGDMATAGERIRVWFGKLSIDMPTITKSAWTQTGKLWDQALQGIDNATGGWWTKLQGMFSKGGMRLTDAFRITGQSVAQIAQETGGRITTAIGASLTDAISDIIKGGNNLRSIFLGLFNKILSIVIDWAIKTILAQEAVAAVLESFMINPWLALGAAVAAVGVIAALQGALREDRVGEATPLAEGGIAVGPTLALIGEGNEPEAVVPLSKLPGLLPRQQGAVQGGQPPIILNLTVSGNTVMNERDIDKLTDRVMGRATTHLRRLGYKPSYA